MASKPDSKALRSDSKAEIASKTRQFGLVPLESFDSTKFPTNAEVLRRIFYFQDLSKNQPVKSIIDQVFAEMEDIYKRGLAIERSTKQPKNCKDQIYKLFQEFNLTRDHFKANRKQSPKDKLFLENLHKLCDISPNDAEKQINLDRLRSQKKKEVDIAFLRDQKSLRKSALDKVDISYVKKSDAKINRDSRQQISAASSVSPHQAKQMTSVAGASEPTLPRLRSRVVPGDNTTENIGLSSEDDTKNDAQFRFSLKSSDADDPDYVQSRFLRDRQKKKNIVTPDSLVLKAGDRAQMSSRKLTSVVGAALVENGEDLNHHVFSHRTIARNRPIMRAKVANEIRKSFKPPKRGTVHFDGKRLKDLNGGFGDRLAVMLSGDTPQCRSGKLLSANLINDGTGKQQADEVLRALKEWNAEMNAISMCFDTTSANTGWINGAATLIEKYLEKIQNRPLLWLPCRHHIPELFLAAAWEALFGKDMSPHYEDFKNFQKLFPGLDKSKFDILGLKQWMKPHQKRVIDFCLHLLNSQKQPRDDYKECLELILVVLGSTPKNFSFKKCGAFHKARWMAPLIYGLKMFLFRSSLPKSIANTKVYLAKLEQFIVFACFFYVEYWFSAPLASEAIYMDLKFYKNMLEYKKHNKVIANAVLDKFLGHTWYLNQCYAPLSLFSKNISNDEKAEIALKLLKVKPPKKYSSGYPTPVPLAQLTLDASLALKLSDFVDNESLFMFDAFEFKKDWLNKPVHTWKNYESFQEMENWVQTLKITNDTAERGIKLVSEFCDILTKDSEDLQNLMQVVEQHRSEYKGIDKKTLNQAAKSKEL